MSKGTAMNKQIEQFALESGAWNQVYGNRMFMIDEHFDIAKFARLIVKECLDACSRANEIRHFVPPTQEQVVLSCMREIETTFRS
jgi:hypothetical protein